MLSTQVNRELICASEFELEYLPTETSPAAVQTFGMFVRATSAHLVAAYLAGRRLTGLQATIVSTLYLVAALIMTWSTIGHITRVIPVPTRWNCRIPTA